MFHLYRSLLVTLCLYSYCNSNIDDVHDMLDDIQEQNEIAEEISTALAAPVGFGTDVDEVSM